ncbi:hypothetical protein WDJ51_00090 [Rathayibacter sp. YIM 133350]|uniref:DUF2231 domain-containing protein n=1 Tax=Rathayibacter sp. YIM 133350 TaxID=3131992 RepID=UPI00307ED016
MQGYSLAGLPLHILLVHVAVILIPVAAVIVLLAAVWPRARRWFGILTPIAGLLAAALVPIVTQAGAWLQDRLPDAPLIQAHAALGDTLWPWTLALGILSVLVYGWYRYAERRRDNESPSPLARRVIAIVLAVAAVVVVPAGIIGTIVIGESGSRAVWEGSFSEDPVQK